MSEESKRNVPQIAITAYESNEEDVEVANLFNATNDINNKKMHGHRSVSPKQNRQKSKIVLKSPVTINNLQQSLSPSLSDVNSFTDVEVMSDSDDEKDYVRTPNLSPGPLDYYILTDVEDLSEDEGHVKSKCINEEHTDTENFTTDKELFNETVHTGKLFDSSSCLPQPHREVLFHSKDGIVSTLSPTEESNPIWLKTPKEEVKGFESEEEIITAEECDENESHYKENNTYYHNIDVGVEESVETIKNERCKHKYKNRMIGTKKTGTRETECSKKRFRNKNRSNSEVEGCFEKQTNENKTKLLSKYTSEPTLNKMAITAENLYNETNNVKLQERNNNKFIIHDNRNGFSISVDFESNNSVLLNIGRDYGNLSLRWFNDGIMTGKVMSECDNLNVLEPLEPGLFIKSSLYDPQRLFEVDLFTYGTIKTLQNRYFTFIAVYTVVQPINIVQLYINIPLQTQITTMKKPLVKLYFLKDQCTSMKRLYPSPVTHLPAFKVFNQRETEKHEEQKKIKFESDKHVSDVINIYENMSGSPKLSRKFSSKKFKNSDTDIKQYELNEKINSMCTQKKILIGNYQLIDLLKWCRTKLTVE